MKKTLKDNIQEHYRNFELSGEQLDNLNSLQREKENRERIPFLYKASFAALAVSVLLIGLYLFRGAAPLMERIAEEVAYNHNKHVQMEVKTNSIDHVQNFLSKIDFTLIDSANLPADKWKLLGGRYCSISGKLAVQMKVLNKKNGKTHTFYQVPYPKGLQGSSDKPFEIYVDGAQIQLWREKGLLLGLAGG